MIDEIIGLIVLTGMAIGDEFTYSSVAWTTAIGFGFLLLTLAIGNLAVSRLFGWIGQIDLPGTATMMALILALSLAWLAHTVGSAMIIGAFAAGVLLARTPRAHEIERGIASLGHFLCRSFCLRWRRC